MTLWAQRRAIYTHPVEFGFFWPPTKGMVSSGYNHVFRSASVFRPAAFVINDRFHNFRLLYYELIITNQNVITNGKTVDFKILMHLKCDFGRPKLTSQK